MPDNIKTLILEDNATDAELMVYALKKSGFNPDWYRVETEQDYLARLDPSLDVILADYSQPQFDAITALKLLQEHELDIPFIIVSGAIGEDVAVSAMKEGADDYLLKDRLARLGPSVKRCILAHEMRMEKMRADTHIVKLSQAVEQSANIVIITDPIGRLEYVNPRFSEITGYEAEEVIGKNLSLLHPGKKPPEVFEEMWSVITSGGVWRGEYRNLKKNGDQFWVSAAVSPILNSAGGISQFLVIQEDINERKRAEQLQDAVYRIALATDTSPSLEDLFQAVYKIIQDVMEATNFYIALYEEETNHISFPLFLDDFDPPEPPRPARMGLTEYVLRSGKTLRCDAAMHKELTQKGEVEYIGTPSEIWLGVPLVSENKTIGVMAVQHYSDPDAYGESEQRILEFVSSEVARAIDYKRTEEELRREREFIHEALNTQTDIFVVFDAEGNALRWNQALRDVSGYTDEEIRTQVKARDFFASKDHKKFVQAVKQVYSEGVVTIEANFVTKDGVEIPYEYSGVLLTAHHKTRPSMCAIGRDISERLIAERLMREERDRAQSYLDIAGVMLLALDRDGNVTLINRKGCEVLGYEEDEIQGANWFGKFIPMWIRSEVKNLFDRLMSGKTEGFEYAENSILKNNGVEAVIAWHNALLYDAKGDIVGTLSSGEDITERKEAEQKLQKTLIDLERSNRELEQFAYIASHDLQEPLRMIVNYLQLLENRYKENLDSTADEFISYAVGGAVRLQQLIQALLAYSRVGTRGNPYKPTDCDTILDHAIVNLDRVINENDAQITRDPLPMLTTDGVQLAQVFQNLIENAIKFRSDAIPDIHIGVERKEGEWQFHVQDNGIGIDPEYAERIFIVFQRLHLNEDYPGTGIGLAICKRIVERLGGQIWVESQVGTGATFYFSLPA